jgi:hypothetical protein
MITSSGFYAGLCNEWVSNCYEPLPQQGLADRSDKKQAFGYAKWRHVRARNSAQNWACSYLRKPLGRFRGNKRPALGGAGIWRS